MQRVIAKHWTFIFHVGAGYAQDIDYNFGHSIRQMILNSLTFFLTQKTNCANRKNSGFTNASKIGTG